MGIYIYMVRCADGSYYAGSATGHDLSTRINQHNAGSYPGYTLSRRPVGRTEDELNIVRQGHPSRLARTRTSSD
jgi:predicted GIY-YIG superfamily endonuclease